MSDGPRDGNPTISEIRRAVRPGSKRQRVGPGTASPVPPPPPTIRDHSGNKYIRKIRSCIPGGLPTEVDVYSVIDAYAVTNPAIAHAIKKLLCAGIRGKGDVRRDLSEAIDAIRRAIEMAAPDDPAANS